MQQATTLFKILNADGSPIDDSEEIWSLPKGIKNGELMDFSTQPGKYYSGTEWTQIPGVKGTWLVSNPRSYYSLDSQRRIFVAKSQAEALERFPGTFWTQQVKLVREATHKDVKPFGIYRAFKPFYH